MSFGYSGSGTGTDQYFGQGTYGSRYTNGGADCYLTQVQLLGVSRAYSSGFLAVGVFRDNSGVPSELIEQFAPGTLAIGTNTLSFIGAHEVRSGESIWVFVANGNQLYFDGSTATRKAVATLYTGTVFANFLQLGTTIDRIVPAYLVGGGTPAAGDAHIDLAILEPLAEGNPQVDVALALLEPLSEGAPAVDVGFALLEPLSEGHVIVPISLTLIEALIPVPVEYPVVTAILPGFGNSIADPSIPEAANPFSGATPGLAFSVHMKPTFNTRVSQAVNFNTIRNPLADYARWEFDCPYEFLDDRGGASSSLRRLMDFFCARLGPANPFLVKNPDFYLASNATIGTTDGARTQWDFLRWIGGEYSEPVGQVDTVNAVNVYLTIPETVSVPGSGPYTVTVAHSAAFTADVGVTIGGTPLTKVASAPGAMQYSQSGGVYTFNSAQHGASAVITYRYLVDPSAYTVTMPNKLVFGSAPASGGTLSWDGQFFFTCYFNEETTDFTKFAKQLWELQSLAFHSELLA